MAQATEELTIEIRQMPGQDYLGKRFTCSLGDVGKSVQGAMKDLYTRLEQAEARPAGPPFLIASPPKDGKMEIQVGAPCTPVPEPIAGEHRGRLEPGPAVVTVFHGPYQDIGPVYEKLFSWIQAHGHRPVGPAREVYLNGPGEVTTPADYVTELIVPIA